MNSVFSMSKDQVVEEQRRFILNVYNWMGSGLFVTGLIAYYVSQSPRILMMIFGNQMIPLVLFIAEIGLVFYLMGNIKNMTAQTAKFIFIGYSALNGLTISFIFLIYTRSSIASSFLVTAGTFAAMSFYGYTTKKDLTSLGSFLIMGLIGLIIASFVNIFMLSPMIYWMTTYAGVLIFVGLTAYDTQKIMQMNVIGNEGTEEDTKEAIQGALILYLDFINLFIYMLRIFGGRRD